LCGENLPYSVKSRLRRLAVRVLASLPAAPRRLRALTQRLPQVLSAS
jgi:hypothetical protein